jgi:hypothetical protein
MAKSSTTWTKGQTGNPRGAPKKPRRLTATLERAVSRSVVLADGRKISGKEYAASLAIQGIKTGEVVLANGQRITLSPEDVLMLWKFVYGQIDGPPPSKTEITGAEGGPVQVVYVNDWRGNGSGN